MGGEREMRRFIISLRPDASHRRCRSFKFALEKRPMGVPRRHLDSVFLI
jgi:hypothetical protein